MLHLWDSSKKNDIDLNSLFYSSVQVFIFVVNLSKSVQKKLFRKLLKLF